MKTVAGKSQFSSVRSQVFQRIRAFHANEDGLNIIEIIIIIFIAVVILTGLNAYFQTSVYKKVTAAIDSLMGTSY